MILKLIPPSEYATVVHELPNSDMVVDPRPVMDDEEDENAFKFVVTVDGAKLRVTRVDQSAQEAGWNYFLRFRVYNRNEDRYCFVESTKYLYHGIKGERAPFNTTEVVVKDGVETIWENSFRYCEKLEKVTLPDSLIRIQGVAFGSCTSLRSIQLPSNLQIIGNGAFSLCSSLEALFIPPTVMKVDRYAFYSCTSLRIVNSPKFGSTFAHSTAMKYCSSILTDEMKHASKQELRNLLRERYDLLHDLCWNPSVNGKDITECLEGRDGCEKEPRTNDKSQFTALHLLAANPSVNGHLITAYLKLRPNVAMIPDSCGKTPLHIMCSVPCLSEASGSAIRAYLNCPEGKKAAFMKDDEGRKPFTYLCEKGYDEVPFLKNKSFGYLMVWWYDCLGVNFFAEHGS